MTDKEFLSKLEIVAAMADPQLRTLVELLIDYYSEKHSIVGFKPQERKPRGKT